LTQPTQKSLVVDTSAAVAVILGEPGSGELAACLEDALVRLMPATIRVELGIVIEARLWPAGHDVVDRFLRDAKVDIVPVDADLADRAMSGWRRYGKGRHPAGLNFGDCFTYALADRTGHPVLCTGDDFAATDIMVVRPGTESAGRPV
jgi:ribonuclease VapC